MEKIFSNKQVILGVTGSIAAYKACELASRLVDYGAQVTAVLTRSAQELVGRATLEALTGQPVITEMFAPLQNREIEHIAVATKADLFLIAPATANILAKAAHGIADDWLSTTLLATRAPILFAPAMNTNMYSHAATQANIELLRERGCHFIGPDAGKLACGDEGLGRMMSPSIVLESAIPLVGPKDSPLKGKRILITSGRNHEPIDPVRFIANRSSGKMGRALALQALVAGADVTVVTGPADEPLPWGVEAVEVETAAEMREAVMARWPSADVFIGAAAVADYHVENPALSKTKRGSGDVTLTLKENPDILAEVAATKKASQIVAGFAAETEDVIANASAKLARKSLDLIVANEVGGADSGFGADVLLAAILSASDRPKALERLTKDDVAARLLDALGRSIRKS